MTCFHETPTCFLWTGSGDNREAYIWHLYGQSAPCPGCWGQVLQAAPGKQVSSSRQFITFSELLHLIVLMI